MTPSPTRRGAARIADIPPEVLSALERGEMQSATLVECLALDHARLLQAAFPELPPPALEQARAAASLGILKRMGCLSALLLEYLGEAGIDRCRMHPSDTVRGWACFMVGAVPGLNLAQRLAAIQPLADDGHFGVREWAWLAARPHLAAELEAGIALLSGWTVAPSERLRRFASESIRPRGVWCAHLAVLKREPALALSILDPLHADPAVYVQDSVANWLNDAAKDQPDWVRAWCRQWQQRDPSDATRRICSRALRNLK